MYEIFLMVLFVVSPAVLFGQQETKGAISGVASDSATGTPVENANVFLSFTTIGASTGLDGSFHLINVPFGAYDLVVSRGGYEREVINIRIVDCETLHYDIRLKPRVLQEEGVNIIAESPEGWRENLERFVRAFVGTTDNADQCRILNPEVLDFRFDHRTDTLIAKTDSVLRIENKALGYRLFILLSSFVWNVRQDYGHYLHYPRLETLPPRDSQELSQWRENRLQSFCGSLKHFLRTLYTGTTEEEKFVIFSGPLKSLVHGDGHRVAQDDVTIENGTPFKTLLFPEYLKVEYRGRAYTRDRVAISFVTLRQAFALIDKRGNLLDPLSVEISGSWSYDRVADLLPMDKEP